MVGLFGTNPGNQVLASINIIGSDIASRLGIENDLEEYKTVVDKSVTNKGITMQLKEVVLDGNEFSRYLGVKILYTDVRSGDSTTKGPWKFEFKTNGDELASDTQII